MTEAALVPALVEALARALGPLGFTPRPGGAWVAAWTRKTIGSNRAVVVLAVPAGEDPVGWLGRERAGLAAALGYVPFLYEVGIQVILVGTPGRRPVAEAVQSVNNQRYIVQSAFLVDPATGAVEAARTWGQVRTGRFQDAVATALHGVVGDTEGAAGADTSPPAIPTPPWGRALPWLAGALVLLWVVRLALLGV